MANPGSLGASGDFEEFATYADAVSQFTGITRRVLCVQSGTLVVKQATGGTTRAISVSGGVMEDIAVTAFVAEGATGCAPIRVYR